MKKAFAGTAREVCFSYTLCGYDEETENAILHTDIVTEENGARVKLTMLGLDRYVGEVAVFADRKKDGHAADAGQGPGHRGALYRHRR